MANQTFIQGWTGLVTITDWISSYLPQIFTAIIFLVAGIIIGKITKWIIVKIGKITGLDKLSKGTDKILHKFGYTKTTSELIGDLIKWVIYVMFIGAAAHVIFGEQLLAKAFVSIAVYLPKVILSAIIIISGLVFGDVLGNVVGNLIEKSPIKLKEKSMISAISSGLMKILIFLIAITIALDIVGIYVGVLTAGFTIVFLAIVLFALIGSRDLALNIFAGIYLQSSGNFRKGITIEFDNKKGKIKEIGLIYTVLDSNKNEIQIPNYLFMKKSCVIK